VMSAAGPGDPRRTRFGICGLTRADLRTMIHSTPQVERSEGCLHWEGDLMPRIEIYDTTLRDGSQGEGVYFSLEDKLLITAKLDELGFDYIEGGYPLSNPKDSEYFQRVAEMPLKSA